MSMFPNPYSGSQPLDYSSEGARSSVVSRFMNMVYAWMCVGLGVTAAVAFFVSTQPDLLKTVLGPMMIVFIVAELVLVWVISAAVNKVSANAATGLFLLYAALNGLTLSVVFLMYHLPTIGAAFVVTAGMFGATSVYGMVTKRDLTGLGSFLFMALIGLILASIVNVFWANSTLYWIVTYAGVFIFVGLTAYDTQKLKQMAHQVDGNQAMSHRMAIVGSLVLYLDFINLFLYMLRILGDRRR